MPQLTAEVKELYAIINVFRSDLTGECFANRVDTSCPEEVAYLPNNAIISLWVEYDKNKDERIKELIKSVRKKAREHMITHITNLEKVASI